MSTSCRPALLCIGAQKSGTTWLYRALERQTYDAPRLWVPPVKELHFWDEKVRLNRPWFANLRDTEPPALRWKRQLRQERNRRIRRAANQRPVTTTEQDRREWCGRYFFGTPSIPWYQGLFGDQEFGIDITPDYAVLRPDMIKTIVDAFPDIKVVYLLRHPVEREWSAAQMAVRGAGHDPDVALRMNRRHAHYQRNIVRWQQRLAPGNLYVGFFEDITLRPAELLASILDFAGCPQPDVPLSLPTGKPNSGNVESIPARFAKAIAMDLTEETAKLSRQLPGPPAAWSNSLEQLAAIPETAADLPYPFPIDPTIKQHDAVHSIIL